MQQLSMICRGCGATIPLIGKVCPHCQRDKTADAEASSRAFLIIAGGSAVGLALGFAFADGIIAAFGVAIVGAIIGGFVAVVVSLASSNSLKESLPPEVRVSPGSSTAADSVKQDLDAESRLSSLEALRTKGLVTTEEYVAKRSEILRSL